MAKVADTCPILDDIVAAGKAVSTCLIAMVLLLLFLGKFK